MQLPEKIGNVGEALLGGMLNKQRRRLRELEAGKAMATRFDPIAALERREKARAERHNGSVVRRLHRQGKLSDRQLEALERWAADHGASTIGARSQLGKDGSPGAGEGASPTHAAEMALSRYRAARAALYVGLRDLMEELDRKGISYLDAADATEAVACRNDSPTAVSRRRGHGDGRAVGEVIEQVRAGADVLERHYRGRGG